MNDHSLINPLASRQKSASLRYRTSRRVNFASAENDVAIIKDIRITLQAVPAVIREKTWVIDRIGPESEHSVQDHNLSTPLHTERLADLNGAETR